MTLRDSKSTSRLTGQNVKSVIQSKMSHADSIAFIARTDHYRVPTCYIIIDLPSQHKHNGRREGGEFLSSEPGGVVARKATVEANDRSKGGVKHDAANRQRTLCGIGGIREEADRQSEERAGGIQEGNGIYKHEFVHRLQL